MKKTLLYLFLFLQLSGFCQVKNPDAILNSLKRKYIAVKDYTVDATIVVDVWFLNMPVKKAKLYYKYPDKIHVETKGFALLPKRTASFDPHAFIGKNYTAVFVRTEKLGNTIVDVVKTIPNDAGNDVILTTFWIDEKKMEIRKMEMNTKSGGTFQVEIEYNNLPFDLPQRLNVVFDMKDMNMPKNFNGEIPKPDKNAKAKEKGKGKVMITYANYKVNTGLSDKIFNEDK